MAELIINNKRVPVGRKCGGCTLCCKLVPIPVGKPPGIPCPYRNILKGCSIYEKRPAECQQWSCLWLRIPEDTPHLKRPDHAGYVIDCVQEDLTVSGQKVKALRIWADPLRPDYWRKDDRLRAWLQFNRLMAVVRCGDQAMLLIPPTANDQGHWIAHEIKKGPTNEHGRPQPGTGSRGPGNVQNS